MLIVAHGPNGICPLELMELVGSFGLLTGLSILIRAKGWRFWRCR